MMASAIAINPDTGFFPLGPATSSAMKRMAIAVQAHLNAGLPIPRSRFAQYVARRICDPIDKQDFLCSISGERGGGKSYTCLYILERIAEEIALIMGGDALDFFDPEKNTITLEDAQSIAEILANKKKQQCLLIDDASVGLSAHDWNSKASKNAIKIFTVMRTRRWCVVVNAPQQKNLDVSLRDFLMVSLNIAGSYHKGGFNLVRANSNQISVSGKPYRHKLSYDGHKIDLWAALSPKPETVAAYDKVREESAIRLNSRIAETGSANVKKSFIGKSKAEENAEADVLRYGDLARAEMAADPGISLRTLSASICLSPQSTERMLHKMGLKITGRPPGRPKVEK